MTIPQLNLKSAFENWIFDDPDTQAEIQRIGYCVDDLDYIFKWGDFDNLNDIFELRLQVLSKLNEVKNLDLRDWAVYFLLEFDDINLLENRNIQVQHCSRNPGRVFLVPKTGLSKVIENFQSFTQSTKNLLEKSKDVLLSEWCEIDPNHLEITKHLIPEDWLICVNYILYDEKFEGKNFEETNLWIIPRFLDSIK